MNQVVLSAVTNYQPEDVAPWINSLRQIYTGDVVVIDYGTPVATIKFLQEKGVEILQGELNGRHIVVERFLGMYALLLERKYDQVLATDIKDVIFQKNPFDFMKVKNRILISSENIRYCDEEWGNNNLRVSYPHMYDRISRNVIYNAGVIGGDADACRDFFLHIYHLSLIGGDRQPDQAAMNILADTEPFVRCVNHLHELDAWSVNLGTSLADNVKAKYKDLIIEEPPKFDKKGIVSSAEGPEFAIVHQWDRVSKLRPILLEKFGKV